VNKEEKLTLTFHRNLRILLGKPHATVQTHDAFAAVVVAEGLEGQGESKCVFLLGEQAASRGFVEPRMRVLAQRRFLEFVAGLTLSTISI
jgi:hypothetical protein